VRLASFRIKPAGQKDGGGQKCWCLYSRMGVSHKSSSILCTIKNWVTVMAILIRANFSKKSQLIVYSCGKPFVLDNFFF
jgi:hypothetical protein